MERLSTRVVPDGSGTQESLREALERETALRKAAEAERDRLAGELAAQGSRVEELFESLPGPLVLYRGPDHIVEYTNPVNRQMWGGRDPTGKPFREAYPEVGPRYFELWDRVYATGEPVFLPEALAQVDHGEGGPDETFLNILLLPRRDRAGTIIGVLAFGIEITEQVRTRRALDREHALLKAILDQMPSGLMLAEIPDGRVTLYNSEAERILGHPMPRAVDTETYPECGRGVHPDGSPYRAEDYPLARALKGEVIRQEPLLHKCDDGSTAVLAINAAPVRGPDGEIAAAVCMFRDITAPKRAEQALRESEERFRRLADSIPHIVWVRGTGGKVEYLNQRYLEYMGLSTIEAYVPFSWRELVHPEDSRRCDEAWDEFIRTGRTAVIEFRLKRASDGQYRWQLGQGAAMRAADGTILRWFGTITDIHDQKTAEEAVREAQKFESVGLLAGGVAHDFNNLLTSVLGYASALAGEVPESSRPKVESVIQAAERAADLTRQLLAYAGKGRFVIAPVDLSKEASQIAGLLRASIPKNVRLHESLASGLPPVEADPGQIQQIVMNLVLNAAEAIPQAKRGTVILRTHAVQVRDGAVVDQISRRRLVAGEYVCLEVRDNGAGMDEETRARIFDPFFTTKFVGRGLGLPAVAGVVKSHNGAIQVTTARGSGTTFRVYLPSAHKRTADRAPNNREVGRTRPTPSSAQR